MSELPKGWEITTLGSLGIWSSGGTPSRKNPEYYGGLIPWVKTGDLQDKCIESTEEFLTDIGLKSSSAKLFPAGTLLLAMYGATIGRTGLLKIDAATNQACAALIANGLTKKLIPFLWWFLIHKADEFKAIGQGGAQPNISQTLIKQFPIALPPLNEQRRIVAKLDTLFTHSRRAREELERVPGLCDRYKQAVLAAACSGRLTADWREEQGSGIVWQSTTLSELIIGKPKNGYSAKPVNYETPFRVLTLTATTSGKFNQGHFKYFDEPIAVESEFWLQPNDILVQRGNTIEYVGVSAIYDGPPNKFIYPDLMMRLQAKPNVIVQFLHMVLSCEESRKYLRDRATGTAGNMPKINQPTLVSLPVDLPPFNEQKEIVQRVEKLFKAIDLMQQEYQKARELCDRLEQATLAKAFRGELVPQNPNDEPASALLERILAEKQNHPTAKCRRN